MNRDNNINQLIKYIIALSNLYGMVHKDKVVEIYNSQNEDQIDQADIKAILNSPPEELEDAFVLILKDYFVKETIVDDNEFDLMLNKKADKPYYVPLKDELLNYVDENYFEKSKQYNDLLSYLRKNFFKLEEEKAEWLADDIQGMCQFGVNMQTIFDSFNNMKISFKDMNQANEVVQLIMKLSNNIRVWENNGYTPNEIFEKFEKANLRPLPDKPFQFKRNAKVGRNDLCPCGSGKKYKKCCLGKGNK